MPNEHDGLTEPEDDLSKVARGLLLGDLTPPPPPSAGGGAEPESELARMLRDASPDQLRRMIVSPGLFADAGAEEEAARHTWDGIVRETRAAVTAVEGEGAWQAFLAREAAAEHEAAVAEAIKEGFLRSLEATPPGTPPGQSALDFVDADPEGTAPAAADQREAPSKFDVDQAVRSLWSFPLLAGLLVGGLAIFIVGYLIFGGGGDDDATNGAVAGGGVATATASATDVGTGAPTTTVTAGGTATSAPTLTAVDVPDLVICPDGSSFSGFEQPDGSYLDATSGEPRACPAAAN